MFGGVYARVVALVLALVVLGSVVAMPSGAVQSSDTGVPEYMGRYRPVLMGTMITIAYYAEPPTIVCSLGWPVYYYEEKYTGGPIPYKAPSWFKDRVRPDLGVEDYYYVFHFGLVTASHCGDWPDLVYQPNITAVGDNYIGSVKLDGRIWDPDGDGNQDAIREDYLVDALYIEVEAHTSYSPRDVPVPDTVSNRILLFNPDWAYPSEATIEGAYNSYSDFVNQTLGYLHVAGFRSGLQSAYIMSSIPEVFDSVCGWVFGIQSDNVIALHGNSGGIAFHWVEDSNGNHAYVVGIMVCNDDSMTDYQLLVAPVWRAMDDFRTIYDTFHVYTGS